MVGGDEVLVVDVRVAGPCRFSTTVTAAPITSTPTRAAVIVIARHRFLELSKNGANAGSCGLKTDFNV
jgi:hypothetical protein